MTHVGMIVASWWITWVLFSLTAWCGLIWLIVTAWHRFSRWQHGKPDDALGYNSARAMLDAPADPWTPADMDILAGRRLP